MRKDIFKGDVYVVEVCSEAEVNDGLLVNLPGTIHYVPVKVCGDLGDTPTYKDLRKFLESWIEAEDITSIHKMKNVWIARDGYGDVTYWSTHRSYKDAAKHLEAFDDDDAPVRAPRKDKSRPANVGWDG